MVAVLDQPLAFFLAENRLNPFVRPADEQLWVEVTIPKKGLPGPSRTKKHDGGIVPL